jgi:hypothetical protein
MKSEHILIAALSGACALVLLAGRVYTDHFRHELVSLEKQRIQVSNRLATAKIVQENLYHVRELVFENMEFPNQKDSIAPESRLFEFITSCVSDLKLKLLTLKPLRPVMQGSMTTYGYELEVEGDFFSFGELCAKFENSRRIASVQTFDVSLLSGSPDRQDGTQSGPRGIRAVMLVNTFCIRKL